MAAVRELSVAFGLVVAEEWLQLGISGMAQVLAMVAARHKTYGKGTGYGCS